MDSFTQSLYGPRSMQESAERISSEILKQPEDNAVIVMAHNGPRGLGSRRHDPCGKDFRPTEGAIMLLQYEAGTECQHSFTTLHLLCK